MASGGNVVIRFITGFVGKGFDLFKAAMSSTGKIVARAFNAATSAAGKLFDGINSQVGSCISQLGEFGKMIAQGGVWGAAQFAVVKLFNEIKERMDAGKRHLESFAEAFKRSMEDVASAIEKRFDKVVAAIARARNMAGAERGKRDAGAAEENASKMARIAADERDALLKASSDSERGVIKANANLARARLEAAESARAASETASESSSEWARSVERVAAAERREIEAKNALDNAYSMRIHVLDSKNLTEKSDTTSEEALKNAKEAYRKAQEELTASVEAEKVAKVKSTAEYRRLRAVEKKSAEQVAAAEFELAEAERAKAEAERKAEVERHNRNMEMGRQFVEQYEARAKNERKEEADRILAEEQEKAKEQQKKIGDNIERLLREIRDIEKARERTRKGIETDHKNHNGLFGPYQYHLDDNGNISDFTDWDRANRYAGHDNDEQKARRRAETDDARMREIQDRLEAGKYVSDADESKWRRWKQFLEERDGEEKRKAQIEEQQEAQKKAVINSEKHLEQIKKDMKSFIENGCVS